MCFYGDSLIRNVFLNVFCTVLFFFLYSSLFMMRKAILRNVVFFCNLEEFFLNENIVLFIGMLLYFDGCYKRFTYIQIPTNYLYSKIRFYLGHTSKI